MDNAEVQNMPAPTQATPARRRWFQFHLSTAIVLMFVAAGLLWINVRIDPATIVHLPYIPPDSNVTFSPPLGVADCRGWPWYFHMKPDVMSWYEWHYGPLLGDAAVVLAILVAVAFLCEWRIRRRERPQ